MARYRPEKDYDQAFFKRRVSYREWQLRFGVFIGERLQPKSVVDFGCGNAFIIEGIRQLDIPVLGYEYNLECVYPFSTPSMHECLVQQSVCESFTPQQADCVICIEVAEHIPSETSTTLVDNISKAATNLVFFTAAPPGQPGIGHINCRELDFWIGLFEERGLRYQRDLTKQLMEEIKQGDFVEDWLWKNLAIFKKD